MTQHGAWKYEWAHGRELQKMTYDVGNDNETANDIKWEFVYNADGLRTIRTDGTIKYENGAITVENATTTYNYVYNGSSLSQMTIVTGTGNTAVTKKLNFVYDASGSPMAVVYNGTTYYYVTNLPGDVIAILDSTGAAVVQYSYDAWGRPLTTSGTMSNTLGVHNPLRYRGYVYDDETGLYYVSSRYYDPEIGRFINADDVDLLGANGDFASLNLFAYCGNNPVLREDKSGGCWNVIAGAAIGGIFELGSQLISNGGNFSEINWTKVGIATAVGGVTAMCGPVSGAILSGLGNCAMEVASGTTDLTKLGVSFAVGVGASLVGYGVGKVAQKIGGKMAVDSLSKKGPGQIKRVVNKVIDVAGKDRNKVKDLSWALSQKAYAHLPDALIGKTIPQVFNSIGVGVSGYGTMGAIYGFN